MINQMRRKGKKIDKKLEKKNEKKKKIKDTGSQVKTTDQMMKI